MNARIDGARIAEDQLYSSGLLNITHFRKVPPWIQVYFDALSAALAKGLLNPMEHEWMLMIQCPVHVMDNGDGKPIVMLDPDARQQAEDEAVYGCKNCDEPLATAYGKDCKSWQTSPR